MLDSLKYVKTLEGSGFSRKQAESQVQVLTHVIGGSMVTKEEFRNGLSELQKDIMITKEEFRNGLSELRKDMVITKEEFRNGLSELQKDMKLGFAESELKMTIRLGVMMATMLGITITVLTFVLKWFLT